MLIWTVLAGVVAFLLGVVVGIVWTLIATNRGLGFGEVPR